MLVFLYKAKGGIINKFFDRGHKIVSPDTYACDLCAMTHGHFVEKDERKQFREMSKIPMVFGYEEDAAQYTIDPSQLPCVLFNDTIILSKQDLHTITSVHDLIICIQDRQSSQK